LKRTANNPGQPAELAEADGVQSTGTKVGLFWEAMGHRVISLSPSPDESALARIWEERLGLIFLLSKIEFVEAELYQATSFRSGGGFSHFKCPLRLLGFPNARGQPTWSYQPCSGGGNGSNASGLYGSIAGFSSVFREKYGNAVASGTDGCPHQ
jgi:hypothetical protein